MTHFDQRYQQVETQYNADHITIQQPSLSLTEKQRRQNRMRMLERVKMIWIDGVLEPSVQGTSLIALRLQNKSSAIVTPLWHVLQEFDTTSRLSSVNTSIVQVYDQASGEVLILGKPGGGKTTLLLDLTRTLLERAHQDESHPIPVVFPLSSWATRRQPLAEWLASELHNRYQVPLLLATSWIETDQVLPLLDGLDEVAAPHRPACIETINTYRQTHGLLPTVVCSRQSEYLALSNRLLLRTAVVVQPLTSEQIESYLTSCGDGLETLHEALRTDADLRELASTPLMLNVLTAAYQETVQPRIDVTGTLDMKQERVFALYVQRMLIRRNASTRYAPKQTIYWLSSLASQMKRQSQTVFYIELMQPTLFSNNQIYWMYDKLAILLPDILTGALTSLAISTVFLGLDPFLFVMSVLLGGLLGGLLSKGSETRQSATNGRTGSTLRQKILISILIGLSIGLIGGLDVGLNYGLSYGLYDGLSYGLCFGLCSYLIQVLLMKSSSTQSPQSPQSPFQPSWKKKWRHLIRSTRLYNGLLVGLLVGLSYGLSDWLSDWLNNTPDGGVSPGLSSLPTSGLNFGMISALSVRLFSSPIAALNANLSGPGLMFNVIGMLSYRLSYGLSYGLSFGLIAGFLSLLIKSNAEVQLNDRLIWSWTSLGRSLVSLRHVRATLQITTLIGVIFGLNTLLTEMAASVTLSFWLAGLISGLSFGVIFGLSYWLLIGLFQGVSGETIRDQQRMVPNQGVRNSALNGCVLGLLSFMIGCLSYELIAGLNTELSYGMSVVNVGAFGEPSFGLIFGLSLGLIAGLLKGVLACVRHYVLRFLLLRSGAIPWNYSRFLDFAAECILLRKVGGGYIFLHRLLLDYFADLEIKTRADTLSETSN